MFTLSFYAPISLKHKKTVKSSVSFVLLGSACVNVSRKILMKSTPDMYESFESSLFVEIRTLVTVELGYNDHGYSKYTVITNKITTFV